MVNFALVSAGASASIAGSVVTNSGAPNNVIDGDETSAWQGKATAALWALKINLGQARTISSFRVNCDAIPGSVTVQSSTDDGAYTVRQSVLFPGDTGLVAFPTPVTARYWQFLVNNAAINSILTMWSWELRDDAGNPWPVMPGTNVSTATITAQQLDQRFTSWLEEGGTDHPNGRLTAIETKVDTIKTEVDDIQAKGNGVNGFAAIKAVADAVSSAVGGLPGTIASAVTTIITNANDNLAKMVGTTDVTLSDLSHDMASVENHYLDVIAKLGAQGRLGATAGGAGGFSGNPAGGWTMLDETDWQGALAWSVPADLYVVTVTDLAGRNAVDVAGVAWYPRLGWWAPLNGTQVGTRRYFDFANCQLVVEGGNMPGVLLKTSPLMSGHIQAWRHS